MYSNIILYTQTKPAIIFSWSASTGTMQVTCENDVRSRLENDAIAAVRAGHISRFQELVERYHSRILTLVGRQLGDAALAEDLTQEVFLRAFRGLKSFRAEASFSSWLYRIALNVCNSYFSSGRYRQIKRSSSFDPEVHGGISLEEDSQDEYSSELKEALRAAIAQLNPPLREALVLCALEGKAYEEAAGILGIPVGTVRSRLSRARLMLRELITGRKV